MDKPLKLLYAEDNPQDADLTRAHFGRAAPDLRLEIAETGSHCLERLAAESFDLLLLDNHLPDMDGLDVLEQIRSAGQRVPVVMITGAGDDEIVARALRAGASDYISNSGDYLTRLPDILCRVVEEHRRHQQFATDSPQRQRRILHVEPNPMDVDLTVRHFASAAPHLKLHSVANCQDALALLTSGSEFDLVLTDLRVPGMNALEFLHEAKHLGCDLPFIVITGRGDEATAVAILRLGAYDYLVKRENYLTQLPHAIDHALQRFQLDQQTRRLHAQLESLNASLEEKVAARTGELQREVDERRRLENQNRDQLEQLARNQAEGRRLLQVAEDSRRALLGVLEDQQRTEQALRDSERHLRKVLDTLPAMIAVLSPEGVLLEANRLPVEMFGLPKEETIGRPFAELPPWDSIPVQQAELRAAIQRAAAGETVHYYVELPLPSGQVLVVATWIVPLKDEAGRVTQLIASGVDITERKRAEDALRDAKRKLDSTVNNLSGFVYRCANQPDWPTEYLGDGVFELFGYPAEDFTSGKRSPVSILEPADRDRVWQEAQAAIAARRPYVLEYRVRTAAGEQKWAWERGAGVFDGDTLVALEGFVTDITDRKRAEAGLIESQQRLALATDSAHIGIWDWDVVANKLVWDATMYELYGIEAQDFGGAYEAWEAGVHPEDRDRAAAETIAVLAGSEDYHTEFRVVWPNGEVRHLEAHGVVQRASNGVALRLLGTNWDITERKLAETALRESEARLRMALTAAAAGSWTWEANTGVSAWDEQFHALYGFTADQPRSFDAWIGRLHPEDLPRIVARLDQMRTTVGDDRWAEEFRSVLPGGLVRWHSGLGLAERDATGAIRRMVGIDIDVTARKQAQEALCERERLLSESQRIAHIGSWSWDLADSIQWTDETYRIYGVEPAMFTPTFESMTKLVHPDDRAAILESNRASAAGSPPAELEFRCVWPNGTVRYVYGRGEMVRDATGKPLYLAGTVQDITERKRVEAALRESQEKLKLAMRAAKMGTWLFDFQTGQFEPDAAGKVLHGFEADEAIASLEQGSRHIHPDDIAQIQQRFEQALRTKGTYENEYRVMLPDGQARWIYSLGRASADAPYLIGTVQDITERKLVEDALRESEKQLRQLFDASPDALFIIDSAGQFLDANQTAVTRYGYSREELLQLSPRELAAPDLKDQTAARVQAALKQGSQFEWRHCRKDGSEFPVEIATQTLTLNGQPVVLSCVRDISERHQAEAQLRESNRRFSTIFHASPVGKCITRFADGVFLDANESFAKITGHAREELLGRSSLDINYWLDPADRAQLVQSLAENGFARDWEVGFRRKDGSIGHSLRSLERLTLDGEDCILTALSDITERKLNEEELRVSRERLETLSRQLIATQESERRHLARELHDEIGQELTSIKLNLKTLEPALPAETNLIRDTLAIAEQALQQVRSLALDLRPSMLDDIGLAPALRWCLDRQAHRSGFAPYFLAEPPELTASPEVAITCFRVMQESLTNIARHAQARNVRVEVRQYESAIDLQVQDDGIGFDVTAATDQATRGASVGLVGMRERAELIGGLIDIESSTATGTTIHARFPLKQE